MSIDRFSDDYEYDIAISFAGEDRELAEGIASRLIEHDVRVFYDELERAELWGKDLYQHLHEIYFEKAQFCLLLVSQDYVGKAWPEHELKAIQARDFSEDREYVLPVRIDDANLPGLSPTIGYISWPDTTVVGIVNVILEKLYGENYANFYDVTYPDWEGETAQFRGTEVAYFWPEKLDQAQDYPSYVASRVLRRIPYGEESDDWPSEIPCHDCSAMEGEFHVPGCDVEQCPLCGGQALSCDCQLQWTAEIPERPIDSVGFSAFPESDSKE